MFKLTEEIINAWKEHEGPAVLTTVDEKNMPNAIYATCVDIYDSRSIVIADNYFNKTRKNILAGNKVSLLFITKARKSYQIKGTITYHVEGPVFDFMKAVNPTKHPGHAAAELIPEEAYSGAVKLV